VTQRGHGLTVTVTVAVDVCQCGWLCCDISNIPAC